MAKQPLNSTGSMFLRISKSSRNIRVARDDEDSIILELETQGETTCFRYIAEDLRSLGMSDQAADQWADKFTGQIIQRGVIENLFEEQDRS